jgi:cysteine desulfurase
MEMKDIAVSTGSACSSATAEPSHVLRAIGMNDRDILSSIRFGLGRFTTGEEIDYTINRVVQSVQVLRGKAMQFAHS